ncbi:NYN domain-containing protein [Halobellus captivus]|uniref:NYN domain-containing protein n=1 Tax=Halobellus captivus TaxID=2592614 RepID=UPI00119F16C2|nr:NYN domain-containing protein [Halobellus captivus]
MDFQGAPDDEECDAADSSEPRVALFVDGPNVLRDEFDVDLDDVREAAETAGQVTALRLYLDEHATPGLIQAAEARGFEVVVTSGDVDVRLAVDVTRFAVENRADVIAIASRDTDFKPAIETANAYGCRTFAIAPGEFGRSDALRNAATEQVTIEQGDEEDGPTLVGYDT